MGAGPLHSGMKPDQTAAALNGTAAYDSQGLGSGLGRVVLTTEPGSDPADHPGRTPDNTPDHRALAPCIT